MKMVLTVVMMECDRLNLREWPALGCRDVDSAYQKLEQIGEGTYGQVFKAKNRATGEIVALKKIRTVNDCRDGFPIILLREIKLLQKLAHPNIIQLKEIVASVGPHPADDVATSRSTAEKVPEERREAHPTARDPEEEKKKKAHQYAANNKHCGSIYMVFEYMDHDLAGLSRRPGLKFTLPQVKCYMQQLLTGLHYVHAHDVLHRDIKGSNLLIDNNGILKIADFGLARSITQVVVSPSMRHGSAADMTNHVITLWYRPPELLLGSTRYGPAVDMWSVGCIFAELLEGKAILSGKTVLEQINKIFELCGYPDEISWPGVTQLSLYRHFKKTVTMKRKIREVLKHFDTHVLDLIDRMLTLDPRQRITAQEALDSGCFWNDPLPCSPKSLPKCEASHEFEIKAKYNQNKLQQQQQQQHRQRLRRQQQQQEGRMPKMLRLQNSEQPSAQLISLQQKSILGPGPNTNQSAYNVAPSLQSACPHHGSLHQRSCSGMPNHAVQAGHHHQPQHGGAGTHSQMKGWLGAAQGRGYNISSQSKGSRGAVSVGGYGHAHCGGYAAPLVSSGQIGQTVVLDASVLAQRFPPWPLVDANANVAQCPPPVGADVVFGHGFPNIITGRVSNNSGVTAAGSSNMISVRRGSVRGSIAGDGSRGRDSNVAGVSAGRGSNVAAASEGRGSNVSESGVGGSNVSAGSGGNDVNVGASGGRGSYVRGVIGGKRL